MLTEKPNKSKFLKISCPRCKKNKTIFGKSTLKIKCENCNRLLIKTQGGKSIIKAKIKQVFPN